MSLPPHLGDEELDTAHATTRKRQKRTQKAPRASERSIQIAIRSALSFWGIPSFHPANGGSRDAREARNLRAQGVVAGAPDLVLIGTDGRTGYMEVKADAGRLTDAQEAFHDILRRRGHPIAVVRSVDDARDALKAWGWL